MVYISAQTDWSVTLGLAVTVGAVCAYGFQALTHELSHMVFAHTETFSFSLCALASGLCNFPWHFYYFNYHQRRTFCCFSACIFLLFMLLIE
jgi:hypothetical protein